MNRNLIVYHMESLNMLNYRMNRELFGNLRQIEERSLSCNKYYSSATSTYMVQSDLAYGKPYVGEDARTVYWKCKLDRDSVFDLTKREGYRTKAISCPASDEKSFILMNQKNYIGNYVSMEWTHNVDDYKAQVSSFIKQEGAFVLWMCSGMSHVENNKYIPSPGCSINRWSAGYEYMDKEVAWLYDLLNDKGLLENTSIIFYGDHGDDIYTHGMFKGLTHAIAPYFTIIHTPFFVFDKRIIDRQSDKLLSTGDIKNIITFLLHTTKKNISADDLFEENEYVISRNMYVGQRVRKDSFGKSYGVCDGKYLLLSDYTGVSLFREDIDPSSHFNILRLFELDKDGLLFSKNNNGLFYHFKSIFDNESLDEIKHVFENMLLYLMKAIRGLYESSGLFDRLYEVKFDCISDSYWNMKTEPDNDFDQKHPLFEFFPGYFNRKVVLYGAGEYGKYIFSRIDDKRCVVAWADKDYSEIGVVNGYEIVSPDRIPDMVFDCVFLAINDDKKYIEAFNYLKSIGIEEGRII